MIVLNKVQALFGVSALVSSGSFWCLSRDCVIKKVVCSDCYGRKHVGKEIGNEDEGFYEGDLRVESVTLYRCPVCRTLCPSEKAAHQHYGKEIAWQRMYRTVKQGDRLKVLGEDGEILGFCTVKGFTWNYESSLCGRRFTIFIQEHNTYYTASSSTKLLPASDEEVRAFELLQRKRRIAELQAELSELTE